MRVTPDRLLAPVSVAAAFGWLAALALRYPAGDGDLLWQRWLGERILHEHAIPRALGAEAFAAAGAPWVPHEWLFATVLAYTTERGLAWVLPALCALAAGGALSIVSLRAHRRGVSSALCACAVIISALAMIQSFGVRAQVFGWAALAALLAILETEGPLAWAAVPLTFVWANVHASAVLAPGLAALFAVLAALRDRCWSPAVVRSAGVCAACALALLATPLGIDLPRYAAALMLSPIKSSISEWGATSITSAAFIAGALPLIVILAAFGIRASLRDRVLACAFLIVLFLAVRNVPIFALVTAPVAFAALPRREATRADARPPLAAAWTTVGAIACAGVLLGAFAWRQAPAAAQALPAGPAAALLRDARATPRVFCEDFAWCSLFLSERLPVTFFMDGRCDPYPAALWREYREVLDGNRRWAAILDARRIDAVLVRRDGALDSLLAERKAGWHEIAADRAARLYVRPALIASTTHPEPIVVRF